MISNYRPITSIHIYLGTGLLFLALLFAGLSITVDLAQAGIIAKRAELRRPPSIRYEGQKRIARKLAGAEREIAVKKIADERQKKLFEALVVRPKSVLEKDHSLGGPKISLKEVLKRWTQEPKTPASHQPVLIEESWVPERLPNGKFRLYDLNDTKSRPSAKLIYKQTHVGIPDESVSLFKRDPHGIFTALPLDITSDPQYPINQKRCADAITDLIATALWGYKKRSQDMSNPQKLNKTTTPKEITDMYNPQKESEITTLEETTEAINELIRTQDYQKNHSVGEATNEGNAKVADIQSTTLFQEEKLEVELKPKPHEVQFKGVVNLKEVSQKIKLYGF